MEIELYEPNMNTLPKFVLEQLEELDKELKEGKLYGLSFLFFLHFLSDDISKDIL